MIRAVISDFGGVLTTPLLRGFLVHQEVTGVSVEDLGRAMQAATEAAGESPLFAMERGEITEAEFLRRLEEQLPDGTKLDRFRDVYFEHLHPNREMIDFMAGLRDRGLRTALLTNNVREWEPLWRAKLPEIDRIFEVVVDSAFVSMRKPEHGIYELTLERLGDDLRPDECVFVDDLEPNCDAARELGMVPVQFEDNEQAIAAVEAALRGD